MKALGLIEVYGYLPAVEALDSALKAANVSLVDVTLVEGGLVTVMITGDVGAVKAAVDASKTAALRVGKVISVHVIARPSSELDKIITYRTLKETPASKERLVQEDQSTDFQPGEVIQEANQEELIQEVNEFREEGMHQEAPQEASQEEMNIDPVEHKQITLEEMQSMTVDRLRKLARELEITNMTRKEIRFATKHELIDKISKFIEEERD